MSYEPRGVMLRLLAKMQEDPQREWNAKECAVVLECPPRAVSAFTDYACRHGLISRRKIGRMLMFRLDPYAEGEQLTAKPAPRMERNLKPKPAAPWTPDADDVRIPKVVAGWTPPKMTPPRVAA